MSDAMDDTNPTPLPPPTSTRLTPITSFSAFHGNYVGIERTGEMKLSLIIPAEMIPEAMKVATARKEVLWVEVSKLTYDETADMEELARQLAAQEQEREKLKGNIEHPELGFSDE